MKTINQVVHNGKKYFGVPLTGVVVIDDKEISLGIPEEVLLAAYEKQQEKETINLRLSAYKSESDPLYMEWQYDQTAEKEQAWRDKVAEIKARYPLPGEA
ncbi:hypothetical protein [Vibrio alginolyticus]|uniref:hypothetical protein n=1 Tax=Vibrio alginolyticus TaxID=663 RepID=UPI001F5C9D49|nr:hypothetical protein [Vibrio alginolyticus]